METILIGPAAEWWMGAVAIILWTGAAGFVLLFLRGGPGRASRDEEEESRRRDLE